MLQLLLMVLPFFGTYAFYCIDLDQFNTYVILYLENIGCEKTFDSMKQ
jgi:hypothetical protein